MAKLKGGTRIYGDIKIDGGIYDSNNSIGVGGSVLISTGVGIAWTTSSGGTSSSLTIYDDYPVTIGVVTAIDFASGLSVTPVSAGIATVTSTGGSTTLGIVVATTYNMLMP